MPTETIYLEVKVSINYEDKKGRKEAIANAKRCALSNSILGSSGCQAKTAKLIVPEISTIKSKDRKSVV